MTNGAGVRHWQPIPTDPSDPTQPDSELAAAVKVATTELQRAMDAAVYAGLRVEVDYQRTHTINDRGRIMLTIDVSRPL